MNNSEDSELDQYLRPDSHYPQLTEQLISLIEKPTYFSWKGDILAIYLQFHLINMRKQPQKIPSFYRSSRNHLQFDLLCSQYAVDKIKNMVHDEEKLQKITVRLKEKCKTKYSTMKKNHKKKKAKDGDYISYIPNMVKNKFERKKYPGLFQELDKWEHEKDEIVKNLQEETTKEDCKGSSKRFNTKRSCKKTKIIRKFD